MAFKATISSAEQAFDTIRKILGATKSQLQQKRALMVAAQCEAQVSIDVIHHLGSILQVLNQLATTPGLAQYARDQLADQSYDIVSEFNATRDAMVACRDGMMSSFPKDANGYLLSRSFNAQGLLVQRVFTAAQLASAVALMDAVIASIE